MTAFLIEQKYFCSKGLCSSLCESVCAVTQNNVMEKKPFYYHWKCKDSPRNKLVEEAFQRTYENDLVLSFVFPLFRLRGCF